MKNIRSGLNCAALAFAASLAACGGGSSDSSTPMTPTPTPTGITLSGTASTGTPVVGKTVSAKCANLKEGNGPTRDDGGYNFSIEGGQWPCLAHVITADGTDLYTVAAPASSTATTAVANITPVTQLVAASLAGTADLAAYYTAFDATAAAAVTSTAVLAAQTAVVATLSTGGIAGLVTASTPLTSDHTAALTSLATVFASDVTTLASLTTTVAATSTTTVTGLPPVTSGTPSLPADFALRPAAGNCAALHSGTYRVVSPETNTALANQYTTFTIDAASTTLSVTFPDGTIEHWTATGPCTYSGGSSNTTDIVVSPSGVLVARYLKDDNVTYGMAIAFPDQAHTLSELSGAWNALSLNGNKGQFAGVRISSTMDATGVVNATVCGDPTSATWVTTTCQTLPAGTLAFRANADGGFDVMDGGTLGGRVFAYRAGGGELMLVEVDNDGSFTLMTHQRTNGLPTVGTVNNSWGLSMGPQLTSTSPVSESGNTVTSVDATAGSYVRHTHNPGTTNDHDETLRVNNPFDGYTYRAPATAPADDGSTATIRDFTALGLRGMGMSVLLLESQKTYFVSVSKP